MRRLVPLLVLVLVLGAYPLWAQEEPPLIPLADAGALANVDRLQRVDEGFKQAQIPLGYPVYVQESNEINAYADGTKIVVYTGLLDFVGSDGEVAYVLGHELAHNVGGHITKQYGVILGLVVANTALSGDYRYQAGHERDVEATEVVQDATLAMLVTSYGRTHEYDADRQGIYAMVQAGYDPHDAIRFQDKLLKKYGSGGTLGGIFSTHPPSEKRSEQIRHIVEDEFEQDTSGRWHRKGVIPPRRSPLSGGERWRRGTRMAAWTGGVSFLVGALEQLEFEGEGWVDRNQRDHNVLVATRNGVIMGFLSGYLLIVDVPGSPPPQFKAGGGGERPAVVAGFDPATQRWRIETSVQF